MTEEQIAQIAQVCHVANKAYCYMLGDNSQRPWGMSPKWQQDSAINGVKFHLANPDASPAASHEAWLAEKRAAGWTYGPVKNVENKTHPCCLPFDQLLLEQQKKDKLFKAIVDALR